MSKQKTVLKNKNSTADQLFKWAEKELDSAEVLYLKKKQQIITELALKLEKEAKMEPGKISSEISRRLVGRISAEWVRKTLSEKYKSQVHVEKGKKGNETKLSGINTAKVGPKIAVVDLREENPPVRIDDSEIYECDNWPVENFIMRDARHYTKKYLQKAYNHIGGLIRELNAKEQLK
jgi:flagellin-specific chaperone FliS